MFQTLLKSMKNSKKEQEIRQRPQNQIKPHPTKEGTSLDYWDLERQLMTWTSHLEPLWPTREVCNCAIDPRIRGSSLLGPEKMSTYEVSAYTCIWEAKIVVFVCGWGP